ncbi:hypothetical protein AB0I85_18155 [Micromonospora echinofusca]|nr:hypothetical protein [Micromonospora sp. MSM11]MCL7458004.1 hypothetical protein [Micromonospora sp. MSM11]
MSTLIFLISLRRFSRAEDAAVAGQGRSLPSLLSDGERGRVAASTR